MAGIEAWAKPFSYTIALLINDRRLSFGEVKLN